MGKLFKMHDESHMTFTRSTSTLIHNSIAEVQSDGDIQAHSCTGQPPIFTSNMSPASTEFDCNPDVCPLNTAGIPSVVRTQPRLLGPVPGGRFGSVLVPPCSLSSHNCPPLFDAPPSPRIGVFAIHVEEESEGEPQKSVPSKVFRGLGPEFGPYIMVNPEFGMPVMDFDFITTIEGGSNLFWRCHWDGCRKMIPALKGSIEDHLELAHGFHPDMDRCHPWVNTQAISGGDSIFFQCRWKPAMFVDLLDGRRVSASTHSLSYYCGRLFMMSEMAEHVAYHLLFEKQPNPHARRCEKCQESFIGSASLQCRKCRTCK